MLTAGLHTADSFSQLITVLLAFVFVLALTLWTTRWIAKYQKGQKAGQNIDVVETCPMGNGKYIQIIRLADKYVAVAVCKDNVTLLAQLDGEKMAFPDGIGKTPMRFQDLLRKAKAVYPGGKNMPKEDSPKEE